MSPVKMWSRLEALASGTAGVPAAVAYIKWLANGLQVSVLLRFIAKHAALLRSRAEIWGEVGFALLTLRRERRAARWLADWRARVDLEPWMLINVGVAHRHVGDLATAAAATEHALALPRDHTFVYHASVGALDAGLRGDRARAMTLLAETSGATVTGHAAFWRALAEAIVAAPDSGGEPDRRKRFRLARQKERRGQGRRAHISEQPRPPPRPRPHRARHRARHRRPARALVVADRLLLLTARHPATGVHLREGRSSRRSGLIIDGRQPVRTRERGHLLPLRQQIDLGYPVEAITVREIDVHCLAGQEGRRQLALPELDHVE